MGGRAEASTTIINKAMVNSIINTMSMCEADARAVIDANMGIIEGNLTVGGTYNQNAQATTTRCSQEDQLSEMFRENLMQQIKQTAGVSGFTLWGSTSSDYKQVHDTINNMTTNDMKRCAQKSDATLTQNFKLVTGNVTYVPVINQNVVSTVEQCVQNNTQLQQQVSDIKTALDSSAKTSGLSISASWLISLAIVIAVAGVVYMIVRRSMAPSMPTVNLQA